MVMRPTSICAIDFEATGKVQGYHEIDEAGVIRVDGLTLMHEEKRLDMYVPPVWPERGTKKRRERNPRLGDLLRKFRSIATNSIPLSHNLYFDLGMISAWYELTDTRMPFFNSIEKNGYVGMGIDTLGIADMLVTEGWIERSKMDWIAQWLDVPHPKPHRAIHDANAALEFFRWVLDETRTTPDVWYKPLLWEHPYGSRKQRTERDRWVRGIRVEAGFRPYPGRK